MREGGEGNSSLEHFSLVSYFYLKFSTKPINYSYSSVEYFTQTERTFNRVSIYELLHDHHLNREFISL